MVAFFFVDDDAVLDDRDNGALPVFGSGRKNNLVNEKISRVVGTGKGS